MSDAMYLRAQAARCFLLAEEAANSMLANELEELGRAFEQEAIEIEELLLRRSAHCGTSVSQTRRRGGGAG
jgi:hypothetical protein